MRLRTSSLKGLSRNAKLGLVLVVLLVVGALGYLVVVRPKQTESGELDAKLGELQTATSAVSPQTAELGAGG